MLNEWSERERERLIVLLCEGATYREIAADIGRSRSAIGAYVMRQAEVREATKYRPRRNHRGGSRPGPRHFKARAKPLYVEPPPEPPLEEPESLGLTLPELTSMQCRWPGKYDPEVEGKFRFCGHPVAAPGRPYCPYHDQIANPSRSQMDGWAEEAVQ